MKIILGLGNPGTEYSKTRHNFGFRVLDKFHTEHTAYFSKFNLDKKFRVEVAELQYGEPNTERILLVKPQTFMNLSGEATRALLDYYALDPRDLLVVHDDADILFRSIKFKNDGGAAGHNGIRSIIQQLGTKNFPRLRLGIRNHLFANIPIEGFVLSKFSAEEMKQLPEIEERAVKAIEEFLESGLESAMNRYN